MPPYITSLDALLILTGPTELYLNSYSGGTPLSTVKCSIKKSRQSDDNTMIK